MSGDAPDDGYLSGQLLLALPGIGDPRFEKSVIFICWHSAEGAMGLIINKTFGDLTAPQLLRKLDIKPRRGMASCPVLAGGPVETSRGFVLHSDDYLQESSLKVGGGMALSSTMEVLKAIGEGETAPSRWLVALGYAGWAPGQLDTELTQHGWLTGQASPGLVFDPDLDGKWARAMGAQGVNVSLLSAEPGHA